MLYVFHVDAGQMATYDMNLTLQSVSSLKAAIERKTKIPASSLVLLVSGGEVLHSDHMVSSYSAGTDTNPIYMFSKPSLKESHLKQSMELSPIVELSSEFRSDTRGVFDGKSVAELKAAVEKCCSLPPTTVHTVHSCANLAQQFSELAHEVSRSCEQLVHEQHLQHQGWAAVVANLEDIYNEFCERSRNFKESFRKHRLKKEEYHEKLNTLGEVLDSLGKIPLLPALQVNAEAHRFSAFDVFEETDFEGHPYRVSNRYDSCSSDNKGCQDFGVDALKLSEEEVFEQQQKDASGSQGVPVPTRVSESDEGAAFKSHSYDTNKDEPTLLHWILAQGNKASLQDIIDYCQKGLDLIDKEPLKEREAELYNILEYANMYGLKQIKGIEDRLYGLDQLLNDVKKLERDQHDQAASLVQYRDRLGTTCDPSVLPTLVSSHWCQLEKLLKGHQVLVDIRRRIAKSKDELSHILKARLEAVLKIENSMSVQDAHAMLSFQCFNRLARYFGIVTQLHSAPAVFVRAVHEVARRRTFSQAHIKWATDLASKLLKIHQEEVARRQEFNCLFEGHFLKSLFPGMTDLPPTFGTQAPPAFDDRLPTISQVDVEFISSSFPEFAKDVPNYDMEATVKFFQHRFNLPDQDERDVDVQVDLSKEESETETSGFERLSRQGSNKQKADISTICVPETMAVSTVTEVRTLTVILETEESPKFENSEFYIEESLPSSLEWGRDHRQDNMDTHKINIEKLEEFLQRLASLCKVNIIFIKEELAKLRTEVDIQQKWIKNKHIEIVNAWEKSNEETEIRFREHTQRLTVDHELELSDMKATLTEKDNVIESLKREREELKAHHHKEIERLEKEHDSTKELLDKTREEIKALGSKLEEKDVLKQKEIKELQEKMHQDYKAEIESLRSRFRLVALTNMDRSPSESSLEKIERTDVIEISSHNAIVMQTKENAEVEKEEAVRRAVAACEEEWRGRVEAELAALRQKTDAEKQTTNEATRRLLSEKDRQLELLREREQNLMRECAKFRETIQQLTDPETNDYDQLLKTQMASLENEKAVLLQQVTDLKKELEKRSEESEKSKEEDSDGRTSPRREETRRRRGLHTPVGLPAGTLSLAACLPGHTVLVMWEPAHHNYTILQEAPIMYFVHSDSLAALDLSIQVKDESERKLYAIGTVESKEFCYAKKSGNRYHMPRGSRFYRVRVRPSKPPPAHHPPCCDHKHKQDAIKGSVFAALGDNRPLKKWLTYVHAAKDMQKSVDTSQSTSSATEDSSRVGEVATATLINLESPSTDTMTASPAAATSTVMAEQSEVDSASAFGSPPAGEDQLDSIETSDQWQHAKMMQSTASALTEMECSVGQCPGVEPLELTVSAVEVVSRGSVPPDSEVAEEASP